MLRGIVLLALFLAPIINAVEVAFFIKRNAQGEVEQYERDSPYTHVAIRVGDQWLEAHPFFGVHLTDNFNGMGEITEVMIDTSLPAPDEEFLNSVLGKRYYLFAAWEDTELWHCGKLVAKFLGIEPQPISIDPAIWHPVYGDRFDHHIGEPGMSPSQLHSQLVDRNYERHISTAAAGCAQRIIL